MSKDYRNNIYKKFKEYVPGEQPEGEGWIKLNTNENPFSPSPLVEKKLLELSSQTHFFRKYPNANGEPLRSTLAKEFHLNKEQVIVTNGSDEALSLICKLTLEVGDKAATPEFTYSLYDTLVSATGATLEYVSAPDPDQPFSANISDLVNANAKVVFFPNPNAPTGEFIAPEVLEKAVQQSEALWIIDEAYNDFVNAPEKSFITRLKNNTNCAVIRTFSKSHALAALRIGYLISYNSFLLEGLRAAKDSYNEDLLALYLGSAAISDRDWLMQTIKKVQEERAKVAQGLSDLHFEVLPSEANFVLAKAPPAYLAADILEELKKRKILVRHFASEKLKNMLRISIGSERENSELLKALREILK